MALIIAFAGTALTHFVLLKCSETQSLTNKATNSLTHSAGLPVLLKCSEDAIPDEQGD